ncbi:hypothetical protein BOX15_Mlig005840g1 [Macrostomum lignano]|uniref:NHL repeat-containing protein n=1 Tax=Macrostomum lignano TaxID=282301 RepID=A0A267ECE7_9PLAT|nr:hypothetical protein BOX15_Mlig005840g1 [Macrostomum lignano]
MDSSPQLSEAAATAARLFGPLRATVDQWERRVAQNLLTAASSNNNNGGSDVGCSSARLGELSVGLRQVRRQVDRRMAQLLRPDCEACRLAVALADDRNEHDDDNDDDDKGFDSGAALTIRSAGSIAELGGCVRWLAVASDTSGFGVDGSGRLVAKESGASIAPAPQPCLFASFDPAEGRRHLLAASLPEAGRRLLRCEADIDWDDWLVGIQCRCSGDGSQRLYVAQESVLTALDLAGRPVWSSRPVSATAGCRLAGLTASPTEPRLFTYDRVGRRVLSVAMATGTWAIAVQLVEFADWLVSGLAAGPDGQLVLSDYCSGRLRFVSADPAPGRLDASYPAEDATEFQLAAPAGLALDLAGRVFEADSAGHVVRVIDGVGQRLLATLGGLECGAGQDSGDEDAFRCPIGVALLAAGDGRQRLAVADSGNHRVQLFEVAG